MNELVLLELERRIDHLEAALAESSAFATDRGPDQPYTYRSPYGFFYLKSGARGGQCLVLKPAAQGGAPLAFGLSFRRNATINVNGNDIPGWVYRANRNDEYRFFFLASEESPGINGYFLGFNGRDNDDGLAQHTFFPSAERMGA